MTPIKTIALIALAVALPAAAQAKAKDTQPRTAASLECSKEADAKNLHGKDRKTFRAKCQKDAKSAAVTPTSNKLPAASNKQAPAATAK